VQNYKKGIIRARKTGKKFPFLQKFFSPKIKKFSKNFYNYLIFSTQIHKIEEKVFQNEIFLFTLDEKTVHLGVILVLHPFHPH